MFRIRNRNSGDTFFEKRPQSMVSPLRRVAVKATIIHSQYKVNGSPVYSNSGRSLRENMAGNPPICKAVGEVCGAELGVSSCEEKMNTERDMGPQPIAKIMAENGLKAADLVGNSTEQLTYKMVSRAAKGRHLTENVMYKVLNALNKAAGKQYKIEDLFNYK